MAIYALANQKGGVGETAAPANRAHALQRPASAPCSSTSTRGERHVRAGRAGEQDVELRPARRRAGARPRVEHEVREPRADPARTDLAGAAAELAQRGDGERFLAESLAGVADRYRFVFLDCPPSLGPLTVNALAAADRVLVGQAEYYALEGVARSSARSRLFAREAQPEAHDRGLAPDDGRRPDEPCGRRWLGAGRHFGPLLFRTRVPRSVRIAEAPSRPAGDRV